jgi:Ca-activated chloride channel homolog
MRLVSLLLICFSLSGFGQVITSSQQKALNNYIDYANQATEETNRVVSGIMEFYPSLQYMKKDNGRFSPPYSCPIQLENFYLHNALQTGKVLNALALPLNDKLKALRAASEKIDTQCKTLDTYYKLQDYKQDNYAKAEELISQFPALIENYKQKQSDLMKELEGVFQKLNKYIPTDPYHKYDRSMRQQIKVEQNFIDSWTFNLNEEIHTGWPTEKLEQSILDTDKHLKVLEGDSPNLKYPASSMISSYKSSLASILESKRTGLDEYNFEAKKSDKHSNDVYMNLINYFNGALVADYNTFIEFSERDNYHGLKVMTYVTAFELRSEVKTINTDIKPFQDIAHADLTTTAQKTPLPKKTFIALTNYIDFINEALRQVNYIQLVLRNLNSSATSYKDLTSFKGKGGLNYDYENFQVPLSVYQKTLTESNALSPAFSKSLNEQAEVLLNILKEIDQLSASMETETKEKRYEKDNLTKLYQILERNNTLFEIFDAKKEVLYNDVRKIYESYPVSNASSSWLISGRALQQLADLDHDALFLAKAYYKGNTSTIISTAKIDETLRTVISNEYSNMKGIEKLGRYNGLCPYSPYEDLPQTSKLLSEKLNKLKPVNQSTGYQHPYHEMVYEYNDIVDDINKFSELSKDIFLLKTIKQPELFSVKYPEKKGDKKPAEDFPIANTVKSEPETKVQAVPEKVTQNINNTSKVVHDTVYIEKRDTIYMAEPGENLRSMEGYATNNMILLLDVSGSMNTPDKLPLLKKSVLDLVTMMRPEDEVSIIVYSGKAKVLLNATSFKEEGKIKKVIESLKSSGKTDGNAGLKVAYKVADENYVRGGNNRIILATDGEFTISDEALTMIENFSKQDIFISVFNFGKSSTSAKNLEKLASTGKGNYEYITQQNIELKLIREAKAKRKK